MTPDPDAGFLLPVDKPAGPSSHDVVALARRALRIRRIGHTGTLDPFASGLLILCVGPATRLAEYLATHTKVYRARVRLGVTTDTDDRTGTIIAHSESAAGIDRHSVERSLAKQVGEFMQTPPAYSAKKVAGERMYAVMRRGDPSPPTPLASLVRVDAIRLDSFSPPDLDIEITCSTGTYIRAIARDIGIDLGCGAHLTELRRTRIGPFRVEAAVTTEQLAQPEVVEQRKVHPLQALEHMPRIDVGDEAARSIVHGRGVEIAGAPASGLVAIAHHGRLLAVGESEGGVIRPRKVFAA